MADDKSLESIPSGCPKSDHVSDCRRNVYRTYIKSSEELRQEYEDLTKLFMRIGGNPAVAESLQVSPKRIEEMEQAVLSYLKNGNIQSAKKLKRVIERIGIRALKLITFLYLQKHTFYFRNLQRWADYTEKAVKKIDLVEIAHQKILEEVVHNVIPEFTALNNEVAKELRHFAIGVLPSSIAAEEECATTHFKSITAIATLLSGVTATTLQLSYQQKNGLLQNLVSLFWLLSLVFSISSGVNSVVSMSWRRSHIFLEPKPPKPFEIWLNKAPCAFLAISVFMFDVGINIFPYSSGQANYVIVSTLAFTALHLLGLLVVTTWFLAKLKWDTRFMQSVRKNVLWALLCDDRVVFLNHKFASIHGWSDHENIVGCPHPVANLARCTFVGIKKFVRGINIGASSRDCQPSTPSRAELGKCQSSLETTITNPAQKPNEALEKAVKDFILHSKNTFSQQFFERTVTEGFDKWKDGSYDTELFETAAKYVLWGFPEILAELSNSILPKMRDIDKKNEDDEKANS